MSTSLDYIKFVCDQLNGIGQISYKKMFGEYMIYVNNKSIFLVCDDTVFVKKLDIISNLMQNADVGYPYQGAKEHYILNIDDAVLAQDVAKIIERSTVARK